jgi:hypothetical protein
MPTSLATALTFIAYYYLLACSVILALVVWPLYVLVGANSPNLCPTIFSVMKMGTCFLPLCTAMVCPIIWGKMVEARDHVFITVFSPELLSNSIFLSNLTLQKGPFLSDRDIFISSA